MTKLAVVLAALLPSALCSQFKYIPGMELRDYAEGDGVDVNVNSLHSHEALVSFDFYSLKFCSPPKELITAFENAREEKLGQVIWGERIEPSLYTLKMKQDQACVEVLCPNAAQRQLSAADLRRFERSINNKYRGNFVIDNLPVVARADGAVLGTVRRAECIDSAPRGWPLGVPSKCTSDGSTHIHNHLEFHITINEHQPGRWIIVAVNVVPRSVDHLGEGSCSKNFKGEGHPPFTTQKGAAETKKVVWSYSVKWTENKNIGWGDRWDAYLALSHSNNNEQVHWVAIINSMLVILCLSVVVAMILLRTLHMDFNRYNNPESFDEQQEEMGWKLVHGDVFRNPPCPGLFAICVGTGVQLLGMLGVTVSFALLGFLSPANRGGLITAAILLFVLMSVVNGVVTGTVLAMFGERKWKIVFGAGLAYPGLLFCLWLIMELYILSSRQGANTAPVLSVLSIMGLWFGVSLPLVVLGAGFGFNWMTITPVTKVTKFARKIPPQRWYLELPVLLVVPGMVPFAAAFIEIRYILYSMWQGLVYYVFGFLAITLLAVLITAAEVAIVSVYFLLVFEDHRWWWRSIAIPGGMGLHFFLYSIYYYKTKLHIKTWLAFFIYFETMAVISISVWIAVGAIGFVSSLIFVRAIYSRIKID